MSKGNVYRAFSVPIYKGQVKLNKKVMNPALKDLALFRVDADDGTASEDVYVLDNDLNFLKPDIQACIEDFVYNHLKFKRHHSFFITNSWVMKHVKGDSSRMHYHTNSLFSGILYLQCDKDSGCISFVRDKNMFNNMFKFDLEEDNPFNETVIHVLPQDGDILLFPSNQWHTVAPSQSSHSRYCVAFNVWSKGPLNKYEYSNSQLDL